MAPFPLPTATTTFPSSVTLVCSTVTASATTRPSSSSGWHVMSFNEASSAGLTIFIMIITILCDIAAVLLVLFLAVGVLVFLFEQVPKLGNGRFWNKGSSSPNTSADTASDTRGPYDPVGGHSDDHHGGTELGVMNTRTGTGTATAERHVVFDRDDAHANPRNEETTASAVGHETWSTTDDEDSDEDSITKRKAAAPA
ncbi:MAG: hypothetical protein M1837_005685 [Sclerophora amabilis]|nr:MAG: hypothetical protein M1837_005685 [Sclerophora amabilis]